MKHPMRLGTMAVLGTLMMLGMAGSSRGDVLFDQSFDSEPLGSNPGWFTVTGANFTRAVVNTQFTSPGQSLDLGHPAVEAYHTAYREFTGTSSNPTRIRTGFDVRWGIDPNAPDGPYFGWRFQLGSWVGQGYLHDQAAMITAGNWVNNGGEGIGFFAFDSAGTKFTILNFAVPVSQSPIPNNWFHVDIVLHYPARTYDVTVTQLTGGSATGTVTGIGFRQASAVTPDQVGGVWFDNGAPQRDTPFDLYIDNLKVETLPPPPSPLNGTIHFQDYSGGAPVLVRADLRQGGGVVRSDNLTVGSDGAFSMSNVLPGTYDVAFKACTYLQKVIHGVALAGDMTLDPITLTSGDIDGDNEITSTDLSAVLNNMDLTGAP